MNEEPKGKNQASPAAPGPASDRSPARSKDHQRDEADPGKNLGQTDEIDGASADEDTYD